MLLKQQAQWLSIFFWSDLAWCISLMLKFTKLCDWQYVHFWYLSPLILSESFFRSHVSPWTMWWELIYEHALCSLRNCPICLWCKHGSSNWRVKFVDDMRSLVTPHRHFKSINKYEYILKGKINERKSIGAIWFQWTMHV